MDGTDTIINGREYKNLVMVTRHAPGTEFDSTYTNYLGGMREENRQVFMISEYLCLDTIERMIYDFNPVQAGDTIWTQILTHGLLDPTPKIVLSVDSLTLGDGPRRRIHLRDEYDYFREDWIEGIGSTMGLVYASYWQLTDNSYDLNCFYEENDLVWTNPAPQYLFCLAPQPPTDCEIINSTEDPDTKPDFVMYPNPAFDHINISGVRDIRTIDIYSMWGQQVVSCEGPGQVQISYLPAGCYIIRVRDDKNQWSTLRFMKI